MPSKLLKQKLTPLSLEDRNDKKIKMQNAKRKIIFLIFLFIVLSSNLLISDNFASAHNPDDANAFWRPGQPLVPCGGKGACINNRCSDIVGPCRTDADCSQPVCDQCQLFHLLRHLIDLALIWVTPIVGTFLFVIAGVYMLISAGNPALVATGKKIFKDTIIGIIIVLLAWVIVNTLIKSLADTSRVGSGGNWFQVSCSDIGLNPNPNPLPPPGCTATVCVSGERAVPTSDGATITWTTNIPATSQVHHGAGPQMFAYTPIDNTLRTSHSVTLSGYPPNTRVRYRVISTGGGYTATGAIFSFTTR